MSKYYTDFQETLLRRELWPQPDFTSSAGISLAASASISGGKLIATATPANTVICNTVSFSLTEDKGSYQVGLQVDSVSAGSFYVGIGTVIYGPITAAGYYTFGLAGPSGTDGSIYIFTGASGCTCQIDNMTFRATALPRTTCDVGEFPAGWSRHALSDSDRPNHQYTVVVDTSRAKVKQRMLKCTNSAAGISPITWDAVCKSAADTNYLGATDGANAEVLTLMQLQAGFAANNFNIFTRWDDTGAYSGFATSGFVTQLNMNTGGGVNCNLFLYVFVSGGGTLLNSLALSLDLTKPVYIRTRIEDVAGQSTLRAKVWNYGTAEPSGWMLSGNTGAFALTPGLVGFESYNSTAYVNFFSVSTGRIRLLTRALMTSSQPGSTRKAHSASYLRKCRPTATPMTSREPVPRPPLAKRLMSIFRAAMAYSRKSLIQR
jgi:hypothetical protein